MESICDRGTFLFSYNGITNKNLNFKYDIKQFWRNWFITTKFSTYAINFKFKTTLESIFCNNFYSQSIYLIEESKTIFMLSKQKKNIYK